MHFNPNHVQTFKPKLQHTLGKWHRTNVHSHIKSTIFFFQNAWFVCQTRRDLRDTDYTDRLNVPQPIASAAHTPAIQGTEC